MNVLAQSTHLTLSMAAASLLIAVAPNAGAQNAPVARNSFEVLTSSGALIPTGSARSSIKDAPLSTVQASYVVRSRFAITTMFGWARSRDLATIDRPKLDVFTYDLGAEARAPRLSAGESVSFTPFFGVGAGARSYNYRKLDVDATHNLAGYTAAGGELGMGRVHLRLEVRDYVAGFKPLDGRGNSATRNDVVALIGLRIAKHGK
jgi:hypothetical protein